MMSPDAALWRLQVCACPWRKLCPQCIHAVQTLATTLQCQDEPDTTPTLHEERKDTQNADVVHGVPRRKRKAT